MSVRVSVDMQVNKCRLCPGTKGRRDGAKGLGGVQDQ